MWFVQREKQNFTAEDAALGRSAYQYVTTAAPQIVDGDLPVDWGNQNNAAPFALEPTEVDGAEVLGAVEIAEILGALVTTFEAPAEPTPPADNRTESEKRRDRVAARQARRAAEQGTP